MLSRTSSKFENTSRLSAEITAALAEFNTPNAVEAYERIQLLETSAVNAAAANRDAFEVAQEATGKYDAVRRKVRLLNDACVNLCEIRGVTVAEYYTVLDSGDDAGLARRLEPEIRRLSGFGPPLADDLAHILRELAKVETTAARAKAELTSSQRALDAAIHNLQAGAAQGRAVLSTLGVQLSRKKKKKADAVKPALVEVESAKADSAKATEPVISIMPVAA